MPEKIATLFDSLSQSIVFFMIGAAIAIGQGLATNERMTAQYVIGRALTVGGLAMAAGAVLAWFPDLPYTGQIGFAAALASLGASGVERIVFRYLDNKRVS